MNSHDNISEELLARYLGGTASEAEINEVQEWLSQSPSNEQELATYRLIWDHSASLGKHFTVDTDAAWGNIKSKMVRSRTPVVELPSKSVSRKFPVQILIAAAVSVFLIAFAFFIIKNNRTPEQIEIATTDNTKEQLLPDGTKVVLNYNSSITYPENFDGDFRNVELKGEAFFDVKRDEAHPFIIEANGTQIRVLGTSFNVKAYNKLPVRVDVASGKVQVSKADQKIELSKGEGAEVLADSVRSFHANMNIMGYSTQVYDFNATNLNDIITSIRDGYHVDIRLSNQQIARCKLTIRFEKEPLDATLAVIAETLELDLRKEGKVYWLDGDGCQ